MVAGDPERVQDLLAAEVSKRFHAPPSAPADLIIVGNHPWPGDPMQSFKVLLQHRAACRSGGVLVGLFWTDSSRNRPLVSNFDPAEDRSDRCSWGLDDPTALAVSPNESLRPAGSPAAFMLRWACELVVDRTVLVYSPPLHRPTRASPGSCPPFCRSSRACGKRPPHGPRSASSGSAGPLRLRVFPQGGLTYVTGSTSRVISRLRPVRPSRKPSRVRRPEESHSGHATPRWPGSKRGFLWSGHSGHTREFLARGQQH